jgi:hypothetical protein
MFLTSFFDEEEQTWVTDHSIIAKKYLQVMVWDY